MPLTMFKPSVVVLLTVSRRCSFLGSFFILMFHVYVCSLQPCRICRIFLYIFTPIVGVCGCSMFCCTLLYVRSGVAAVLMGRRGLVALLGLSSWCLMVVGWLLLAVPRVRLRFVIVVFPDHTHLLFLRSSAAKRLTSWLSCVLIFLAFLSLSYMVFAVRYNT